MGLIMYLLVNRPSNLEPDWADSSGFFCMIAVAGEAWARDAATGGQFDDFR